jgi:glutathione reductase (NADPH)
MKNIKTYDLICIGGGSGGIAAGVMAAKLGKKVAIIEKHELGGTCVNRGCVPKKAMWYAANLAHQLQHDYAGYGFNISNHQFSWETLVQKRDAYITNIHKYYNKLLSSHNIDHINAWGTFQENKIISLDNGESITANDIIISPGASPSIPNIPGSEFGITSDDFFDSLPRQPNKVVIVGAGYIAVELAGVLHSLGSATTLLVRKEKVLRQFDDMLSDTLMECMSENKQDVRTYTQITKVTKDSNGLLNITLQDNTKIIDIDCLIWAIGRTPNTYNLGLKNTDINTENGFIPSNEYQETNIKNVYSIGDVTGNAQLTPVAIAAGRRLARRLYNNETKLKANYKNIATVVFSHPPIATIGLSENEAINKHTKSEIKVYNSKFTPLYSAISGFRTPTSIKLIVQGDDELIIGCHIIGLSADEMIQGFAVAINMGATKNDFDNTVAIHPTSAEELVTLR